MELAKIHQIFLRAAIECAEQGASAKDLAEYLSQAAKGMGVNAAFGLEGDSLVEILKAES